MVIIGLPAYNETHRISGLIVDIDKSLKREALEYKIIVYDDGSSDDTVSKVKALSNQGMNVHLIEGVQNKGLGYALSSLIEYSVSNSSLEDVVIIMDADATHNPEHINRMISYIHDGFDVVVASRYTAYSRIRGLKLYRQLLSNSANFMFRLMFPIRGVKDYSCSYRAYTAKILKMAKDVYKDKLIEEHGFACMAEFLIKLRKLDIIACEVPLILRYDKKSGPSKMCIIANIFRTTGLILRSLWLAELSHEQTERLRGRYKI